MVTALVSLFSDGVPLEGRETCPGSALAVAAASPEATIPPAVDVRNRLFKMLVEPPPVSEEPNTLLAMSDEEKFTPKGVVAEIENPAAVPVFTIPLEVVTDEAVVVTCTVFPSSFLVSCFNSCSPLVGTVCSPSFPAFPAFPAANKFLLTLALGVIPTVGVEELVTGLGDSTLAAAARLEALASAVSFALLLKLNALNAGTAVPEEAPTLNKPPGGGAKLNPLVA